MLQKNLFESIDSNRQLGRDILDLVEKSVYRIGIKEFSYLIGKEQSQVRDALAGNGKYFSVTLSVLLNHDHEFPKEFIGYLSDLCGYERPSEKKKLTPEERLQKIMNIIETHKLNALFEGIDK